MAKQDLRIPELPVRKTGPGLLPVFNNITDDTEQVGIQQELGAIPGDFDWQATTTYNVGDFVRFRSRVWRSLTVGNIGNVPTEGANWTEEPISKADGITLTVWASGMFTFESSVVIALGQILVLTAPVPYKSTDISAEVTAGDWQDILSLSGLVEPVPSIQFENVASDPAYSQGLMWYNSPNWNLYDNVDGTSIQIGKELVVDVFNATGTTLNNLTPVIYDAVSGGLPTVKRAQADTVENVDGAVLTTHDISNNDSGKVATHGTIGGDFSAYNVGDLLFVSASAPGELTNVEQEILKPMCRVLVADTEANGGKAQAFQRGVVNVTAIGQATGISETQAITATPAKCYCFDADKVELNTTVTQTQNPAGGENGYDAVISPASAGATGFYSVAMTITITGTGNAEHIFELYRNGASTGYVGIVDLSNNQLNSGNATIVGTLSGKITASDTIEVYVYTDGVGSTVTYRSSIIELTRIGNV